MESRDIWNICRNDFHKISASFSELARRGNTDDTDDTDDVHSSFCLLFKTFPALVSPQVHEPSEDVSDAFPSCCGCMSSHLSSNMLFFLGP